MLIFLGAANKKFGKQDNSFFLKRVGRWLTEAKDRRKLEREAQRMESANAEENFN
jgi:hypothetical protein